MDREYRKMTDDRNCSEVDVCSDHMRMIEMYDRMFWIYVSVGMDGISEQRSR